MCLSDYVKKPIFVTFSVFLVQNMLEGHLCVARPVMEHQFRCCAHLYWPSSRADVDVGLEQKWYLGHRLTRFVHVYVP